MSYPYPPMGPGQPPSGGQPGGWGGTPPAGGYGPPPQNGYGAPEPGYGPPPEYPPMQGWQGPEGGAPMGPPPKKGGGAGVIAAVVAGAVLVVGGAIGGAYYLASSGGDDHTAARTTPSAAGGSTTSAAPGVPPASGSQNKPVTYNSMKSWSLWDKLNTAAGDSSPMTLNEVFTDPESKSYKDSSDNTVLNLQGTGRLDTDCGSTVTGVLKTAVTTYGCSQVIRAAYVSADQHWVGQLAIFNLKDVGSANAFLDDLDPKSGKGWYVPVTGASPVDKFGTSPTGAQSGAYGHFVVVGWAGRADGVQGDSAGIDTISPSSAVQQAGKQFLFQRNIRD
jgi:hypothetical protein